MIFNFPKNWPWRSNRYYFPERYSRVLSVWFMKYLLIDDRPFPRGFEPFTTITVSTEIEGINFLHSIVSSILTSLGLYSLNYSLFMTITNNYHDQRILKEEIPSIFVVGFAAFLPIVNLIGDMKPSNAMRNVDIHTNIKKIGIPWSISSAMPISPHWSGARLVNRITNMS